MRTEQRQQEILRRLYASSHVEAWEFAAALGVSPSTIRRDLDALARAGRLERTSAGARVASEATDIPYRLKQRRNLAAKQAIGAAACELVRDGDSLLLDSGSTTYQVAVGLRSRQDLTIVTNDLRIGHAVADWPGVRLLVTGGEMLSSTYTLYGDRAVAFVENLHLDWTFLGVDAIDASVGITNTNTTEIALKRTMLSVARTAVALVDSSKFGKLAPFHVADIAELGRIITDDGLDDEQAALFGDRLSRAPMGIPSATTAMAQPNGTTPAVRA